MDKKQYIEYRAVCGGCNAVLEQRSNACPSCGVRFIKRGETLKKLSAHLKVRQKELLHELNCHGNYDCLDELSDSQFDELKQQTNIAYRGILNLVNKATGRRCV